MLEVDLTYQMKSKKLTVIQEKSCFSLHEKHDVCCQRKSCDNWIDYPDGKNCVIVTSKSGPRTLQEIGRIYGLTKMRICQIEKSIYEKLRNVMT
jgi:Sigma-70, region 4